MAGLCEGGNEPPGSLKVSNYNVIAAEYGDLMPDGCFVQAIINLPVIANCTAQLIDFLVKKLNVPLQDIHVIGFSLGAHVTAQISNFITVGKLKRITGLDPADPLFLMYGNEARILRKDDAEFVDVVHTNGGSYGQLDVLGHVDFFMNGGSLQPDCQVTANDKSALYRFKTASIDYSRICNRKRISEKSRRLEIQYCRRRSLGRAIVKEDEYEEVRWDDFSCSHNSAHMYFAESITTQTGFWGYQCSDITYANTLPSMCDSDYNAIMGEYANSRIVHRALSVVVCLYMRVERIPNLTGEQSDGITVFRIAPMTSLMLHRCRTGAINLQRWWQSPSAAISESDWFLYRAGISRRITSCTVVSWRCVLL
ncbi:hypothetical protein ANN_09147 [Periplaneta americana]|uniref:Lipase domain-containing protein n=1 Tax=Periplaneta americana TaxID=6978 RepID=A0ABQ8TKK1_PERAM|nr:hypothetical protein ANN_09147 [Periplaneta americana]